MDNNKLSEVNNKNNNVSYKKIILIFGLTLAIILALAVLFYKNISKETSRVIKASVKYVTDDYIIVTDEADNSDYIIDIEDTQIDDNYEVGDKLSLRIDKINDNKDPIEAEVKDVKLISKASKEEKEVVVKEKNVENNDKVVNDSSVNNNAPSNNEVSSNEVRSSNSYSSSSNSNKQSSNTVGTESDVVTFFNEVNAEVDKSGSEKKLSESAKNGFVTVVDFLFYDKPIKGKTFKELSTSAKLKVLKLAIAIDKKIDNNFPDYKNTLSSKYQNVKSKAISMYLDKTSEICAKDEDTCTEAKKGLTEMKNNFSITWNMIKEISGVGISKLKSWYEVWREA